MSETSKLEIPPQLSISMIQRLRNRLSQVKNPFWWEPKDVFAFALLAYIILATVILSYRVHIKFFKTIE